MTRSLYALAIVLTAITVGCHEGETSDPVGSSALGAGHPAKAATSTNILILDPKFGGDRGDGEYTVTGQVRYGLTQRPIMSRSLFDVVLGTQAKVTQAGSPEAVWTVNNTGSELVDLTNRTAGTVDKWYFLQGGPYSASLHIRFVVTETTVSLASVTVE